MFQTILLYIAVILFVAWLATPFATWQVIAWVVSRKPIANWIIRRAMRTPYTHLPGYMKRYWLFNPYETPGYRSWLPSARVHHILRKDNDRHKHDHPWDARTIILKNWYEEEKVVDVQNYPHWCEQTESWEHDYFEHIEHSRRDPGDTTPINFGEYHSISAVAEDGVWTLFITFGYKGTWGFLVDGVKVPWREYMAQHPEKPWAEEDAT